MVETALSSVKGVVVAQVSLRKNAAIVLVDTRLRYAAVAPPPSTFSPMRQPLRLELTNDSRVVDGMCV